MIFCGGRAANFVEEVEYQGRRLAKLNMAPARIMQALAEFDPLAAKAAAKLGAAEREELNLGLREWRCCTLLTLNNAFRQVAEAEAQAYHDLFRIELETRRLDELLSRMLERLASYCRADAAALYLREGGRPALTLKAAIAGGAPEPERGEVAAAPSALRRRLAIPRCEIARQGRMRQALRPGWAGQYTTCWSAPMTLDGSLLGVMQFAFRKPYEWLPRELELLSAAAERCLMAAEKARLGEELEASELRIRQLAASMLQIEERERRRISAELHDEAGQSLLCIRLRLEMLEKEAPASLGSLAAGLAEVRAQTERTVAEIRRLIRSLSPTVLEKLGLASALRQLASQHQRVSSAVVRLHMSGLGEMPEQIACAVYRLAQESLNNIAKHAKASHVNLSVVSADNRVRFSVEDDGVGFCVEEAMARNDSFGLAGMRERVALLGGTLQIHSQPGRGVKLLAELPLPPKERGTGPGKLGDKYV